MPAGGIFFVKHNSYLNEEDFLMTKTILTSLLIILFGVVFIAHAEELFAPKLKVPSNIEEGTPEYLGVMVLKAAVVPSKSSVGIQPYPNAKIIQTTEGMEMEINGNKLKCYPYIKMLSTDDGDKIISFYKGNLNGYKYMDKFGGMIKVFWKGGDDFNPIDVGQRCKSVSVQVSEGSLYKELLPEVQSVIEITYKP
jgi:hypothetical protein